MQDRYIQKRIENRDLPEMLFRVTKVNKNDQSDEVDLDELANSHSPNNDPNGDHVNSNGYFKILRSGNF